MTTVKIIPNPDGKTLSPYTSSDDAMLRSFGAYDGDTTPDTWTAEQYRAFAKATGLRIVRPS